MAAPEEDPRDANGYYATSSVRDSLLRHPGQYYETSGRESAIHPPSSVYPSVLGAGRSMAHLNSQQLSLYETEVLTLLIENFKKNTYIEADPCGREGRSSVHITQTIMEGKHERVPRQTRQYCLSKWRTVLIIALEACASWKHTVLDKIVLRWRKRLANIYDNVRHLKIETAEVLN